MTREQMIDEAVRLSTRKVDRGLMDWEWRHNRRWVSGCAHEHIRKIRDAFLTIRMRENCPILIPAECKDLRPGAINWIH